MNPLVVTMHGPGGQIDIRNVSNFEAGIAALTWANMLSPGITFGKLAQVADGLNAERMSGLTSFFKGVGNAIVSGAGNIKDGIGDILKDTSNTIGGNAGDAIRLVTDEKVIDGASRIGAAYATSGGSEGVKQLLGGGDSANSVVDFISALGSQFKAATTGGGGTNTASMGSLPGGVLPWAIAGGGALLIFALRGRR